MSYLSELHRKPDRHKKRFALLASGTITLIIFGVWSMVNFGTGLGVTADSRQSSGAEVAESSGISPFESLRLNLAASIEGLRSNLKGLKAGLDALDLEAGYNEMKNRALNIYGQ